MIRAPKGFIYKNRGYNEAIQKMYTMAGNVAKIGWPEGKEASSGSKTMPELAFIASVLEYGAVKDGGQHIQPRPFFSDGILQSMPKIKIQIDKFLHLVVFKKYDVLRALDQIGEFAANLVRDYIINQKEPGNKPTTIKIKGFDDPWVWTGQLTKSLTNKTVGKSKV